MKFLKEWIDEKINGEDIDFSDFNEFSNLENIDKIIHNTYGTLKKANWENRKIIVVLKNLNNTKISESEFIEFVAKLKVFRKIDHSNINHFFGLTRDSNGNYFSVLQYANEGNLRDYLKIKFSTLRWNDKLQIALDITRGLMYLHSEKLVHGNLHACNVLVNNDGEREEPVANTPSEYLQLYQKCWQVDPIIDGSHTAKITLEIFKTSPQQIIRQFKLNHGLILNGTSIMPSIQEVTAEDGELKMNLYNGEPLVYTYINSKDNDLKLDNCIDFPVVEIIYNGNLLESFLEYTNDEKKLYGDYLARKFLAGGKLFIKNFNLATPTQIDILKYYLLCVYQSVKYSTDIQFSNLFTLNLLPELVALDGEKINTHENLINWMNNLYQKEMIDIISYDNLISISQLRLNKSLVDSDLETFKEKQPGVVNFKEKLSLKKWVEDAVNDNLIIWTRNFGLFQGLIINNNDEIEISKKIPITIIKIPEANSINKSYLELIKPSTKLEFTLFSNHIFSKNLSTFPFIKNSDRTYKGYNHVLVKCEKREILLNTDSIKPTKEFEQSIEKALNGMNPLKVLQDIFDEYGHLFPKRIVLGRYFKNILQDLSSPNTFNDVNDYNKILETLDDLNISYLLTQNGRIIEKNDLHDWIQNNDNLEIVKFDNIIPLYEILGIEQQRRIDDILKDNYRIIMTGVTDLKDLNNDDDDHYKRIDFELSFENWKKFMLYDFNGFYAIIKKIKETSIDITECYVSWVVIGKPSQLSVFSPSNRELQVDYIKKTIKLQPDNDKFNYTFDSSFTLHEEYTIFVHANDSSISYEPNNIIKIVEWNERFINVQIESAYETANSDHEDNDCLENEIDLHICILSTNCKYLKIDNAKEECPLNIVGYILDRENFNRSLSQGEQIKIRTNYFEVTKMPKMKIIHYVIIIKPEVPPRLNRKVLNHFSEKNQKALGGVRPVFDGKTNMFTYKPLPFESKSFDMKLEKSSEPVSRRHPPKTFKITIRKARDIDMEDLFQFLHAKGKMTNNCRMAIMAMNIIINHKISTEHPIIRNSFYTSQEAKPLSGGIEAWQRYYQTARPTRGKMMINIDVSTTAFYEGGPLIRMIAKILGFRSLNDLCKELSDKDRQKVEKRIKNLKISDNHSPENQQKFKIRKLTQTSASHTMVDVDGSNINVKTYFQNMYNRRLLYPFLPCIVVRENIYLPIEVCDVIPEQRYMQILDTRLADEMTNFARQNPNIRANKIKAGLNILDYKKNEYLKQFGMEISNDMAVVNARILPTPTIQYHQSSRENRVQPNGGSWNLRNKKVINGATLSSWSVLAFLNYKSLSDQAIKFFVRELIITCQDMGMNISEMEPLICRENPIGNTEESLKKAWLKAGNKARGKPQLVLCILPNTGSNLYAEIKRVGDTVIGVATQCIQSIHTINPKKQYCANVCLKMNVKLGGENSFLIPEHIQFVEDEPTILMGADITKLSPGDSNGPSYAALCGSVNTKAFALRYATSIRVQTGSTEIITDLANMVKELLKTFYQTCGRKPKKILFYRNGVSESQFIKVLECELTAIKEACQNLEANYKPTITFVVVQKRHHTRFFPIQGADRTGNCFPGTVVDMNITHPFEFDFYLLSHAGLHGTLQMLCYNLCHTSVRCTRAVSLVPPVYYAHLAAARARLHSSECSKSGAITFGVVKQELQKVMYFI
ncbi:unnamed protein product [Rhizophagus irregularis]|uniref:Piwi-domain-containing protein n=1 Tax=Rhizophagus irregularis TaxID=588596 RepID=A0A916EJP9_9GLOM|nr:unnamed protein product [Rhizophagus irregularis]